MTVEDVCVDVFDATGENDIFNPYTNKANNTGFSVATSGGKRLLRHLNRAIRRIANYKFKDGRQLRFNNLTARVSFKSVVIESALVITAEDGTVGYLKTNGITTGEYDRFLVKIFEDGEEFATRYVVKSVADPIEDDLIYLNEDVTTDSTKTYTLTFYKNFYDFVDGGNGGRDIDIDPNTEFFSVQKILDLKDMKEVVRGEYTEAYPNDRLITGVPSSYLQLENGIFFPEAPEDARWYEMEYYRMPDAMTSGSDTLPFPESWTEPVILYTTWVCLKSIREDTSAYAMRRDFEEVMRTMKQPNDVRDDRTDGHVIIGDM